MHYILWCNCFLYISTCTICFRNYQEEAWTGHRSPKYIYHDSWQHHWAAGILINNTYFLFQDQFYEQTKGVAMGSPVSGQYLHAGLWRQSHINSTVPQGYGRGMLMIPLWFNIIHIKRNSSGTSTQWTFPSSSLWRNTRKMIPYLF